MSVPVVGGKLALIGGKAPVISGAVLPGVPGNVGQIADSMSLTSPYQIANFIDWTAATAGTYSIDHYKIYVNGVYTLATTSGSGAVNIYHYYNYTTGTSGTGNVPNRYQVSAVDTHGNEGPMSTVDIFYLIHNGHGVLSAGTSPWNGNVTGNYCNALMGRDLGANGGPVTFNATGGSTTSATFASGNVTTNQLYGQTITDTTTGDTSTVTGNTATSCTFSPAMSTAVSNGDALSFTQNFVGQCTLETLPGHTYACLFPEYSFGLWQEASTFYGGFNPSGAPYAGEGPFCLDVSRFTGYQWNIWTPSPSPQYQLASGQNGYYLTNNDVGLPSVISDLQNIPAACINGHSNTYAQNAWFKLRMPTIMHGHLLNHGIYKWALKDNAPYFANGSVPWFLDDVGFVSGAAEWIHNGGTCNGNWGATSYSGGSDNLDINGNCWHQDAATLLNGWTDNSSNVGGTVAYNVAPTTLTQINPGGANGPTGMTGLCQPGLDSALYPTVISVTPAAANDGWQILNSSGRSISGYNYFGFAHLPTNATYGLTVQFTNSSGTPIGTAVAVSAYTDQLWGPGAGAASTYWTKYAIPLSAFGSIGSTVYGLQITDSGGHEFYLSGPALYQYNG